ncbi:hypothetical protein RB195_001590 [Necator americanus]|uniref:Transmembrane protein 65 n=2 Tax=Necator americanus TaxID=51031 RepID=A0ABR1DFX6_NECAM
MARSILPSKLEATALLNKLRKLTYMETLNSSKSNTSNFNRASYFLPSAERVDTERCVPMTDEQTRALFLVNSLPFIGFGFLDNMIMIIAGEYIDQQLGTMLCLSTMAAAALGNLISDVAGVGLAHYVEGIVYKIGLKHPVLTSEQLESSRARWTTNFARAVGLSIGCIVGMFPLLFFDKDKEETENEAPK